MNFFLIGDLYFCNIEMSLKIFFCQFMNHIIMWYRFYITPCEQTIVSAVKPPSFPKQPHTLTAQIVSHQFSEVKTKKTKSMVLIKLTNLKRQILFIVYVCEHQRMYLYICILLRYVNKAIYIEFIIEQLIKIENLIALNIFFSLSIGKNEQSVIHDFIKFIHKKKNH